MAGAGTGAGTGARTGPGAGAATGARTGAREGTGAGAGAAIGGSAAEQPVLRKRQQSSGAMQPGAPDSPVQHLPWPCGSACSPQHRTGKTTGHALQQQVHCHPGNDPLCKRYLAPAWRQLNEAQLSQMRTG